MNYFEELKKISDSYYVGKSEKKDVFAKAFELLKISDPKFKIRQDDGKAIQLNFSIPRSLEQKLVVGIRYLKKDGSNREDHFIFNKSEIIKCYGKSLESLMSEYKGAHVQQIDLPEKT